MFESQQKEMFLWFDTDHIKDLDKLTNSQISYLNRISFNVFTPFNLLLSRHWDLLLTWIIYRTVLVLSDSVQGDLFLYLLGSSILFYSTFALFGMFQGRRLDWNRNKYESFEAFQKSSNRWNIFGVISVVVGITYIYIMA